ncbi:hypothetical protein BJX66DRAFT_293718, partial [Aspergillus keveii]
MPMPTPLAFPLAENQHEFVYPLRTAFIWDHSCISTIYIIFCMTMPVYDDAYRKCDAKSDILRTFQIRMTKGLQQAGSHLPHGQRLERRVSGILG